VIVPSEPSAPRWSPHHQRLHRHLLRHPTLLPAGAPLLVAVSGGQDSMALTALLADLRRLHGWRLQLWHGDHGWRPDAAAQAKALAAWAAGQGLPLRLERAAPSPQGEAAARQWRYSCLGRFALAEGCRHVVTGHTASDRAETVLLNLARGSHRLGLGSLRARRSLDPEEVTGPLPLQLVRPLLPFSRLDTARICRELELPVWEDASNAEGRFARNRIRAEVLPVLEALHPGAARRIAAQAERLEQESDARGELLGLALENLTTAGGQGLARQRLGQLAAANRRQLLEHWLRRQGAPALTGEAIESLSRRLAAGRGPGQLDLANGWRLRWDRSTLELHCWKEPPLADG
jgi:tRNA(Ile)-lysidine synthase